MDHEPFPSLWAMLVRRDVSVRGQETYENGVLTLRPDVDMSISSWVNNSFLACMMDWLSMVLLVVIREKSGSPRTMVVWRRAR